MSSKNRQHLLLYLIDINVSINYLNISRTSLRISKVETVPVFLIHVKKKILQENENTLINYFCNEF